MQDIAQQVGVSVNAVSLALKDRPGVSDDTRQRVREIAQKIGQVEEKGPPAAEKLCFQKEDRRRQDAPHDDDTQKGNDNFFHGSKCNQGNRQLLLIKWMVQKWEPPGSAETFCPAFVDFSL